MATGSRTSCSAAICTILCLLDVKVRVLALALSADTPYPHSVSHLSSAAVNQRLDRRSPGNNLLRWAAALGKRIVYLLVAPEAVGPESRKIPGKSVSIHIAGTAFKLLAADHSSAFPMLKSSSQDRLKATQLHCRAPEKQRPSASTCSCPRSCGPACCGPRSLERPNRCRSCGKCSCNCRRYLVDSTQ